jgi:hypothetical protein
VRLDPNPVLQELDQAVGLRTIVLSDSDDALTGDQRTRLLSEFLSQLSTLAGASTDQMFVSSHLLQDLRSFTDEQRAERYVFDPVMRRITSRQTAAAASRRIPEELKEEAEPVYIALLTQGGTSPAMLLKVIAEFGVSTAVTSAVVGALLGGPSRERLLSNKLVPWELVWSERLDDDSARNALERLRNEISFHDRAADADLAFAVDIAKRLVLHGLSMNTEIQSTALEQLSQAQDMYPEVEEYEPDPEGPPRPDKILDAIEARRRRMIESGEWSEDEEPF